MGTQTDLRDDPSVRDKLAKQKMSPVRKEDGDKMAKDLGAVKYVECSALTQYKLKDVFDEVCAEISGVFTFLIVDFPRPSSLHWSQLRRRAARNAFCYRFHPS